MRNAVCFKVMCFDVKEVNVRLLLARLQSWNLMPLCSGGEEWSGGKGPHEGDQTEG